MKRTLIVAAAALALVAAGCGSSNKKPSQQANTGAGTTSNPAPATPSTAGGKGSNLKLAADPSGALKFDKSSLSAKAGKVSITMDNPASVPHGVAIEGNGVDEDGQVVNKGGVSKVSASLKPGKYTFYCPVPGHRQAGMQGTLTVK
jgi:uncharacterized cupredoxin-like copper-binding protein